MTGNGIALGLALALPLAACGGAAPEEGNAATNAPAPQAVAAGPPANATAPKPPGPPTPPPAVLGVYVGHYPFDEVNGVTFLAQPQVRAAVAAAVPDDAEIRNLVFEGAGPTAPIARRDGRLLSWGCEAHNCGPHNWAILIDEAGAAAEICYHDDSVDGEGARWCAAGRPVETRSADCPSE